MNAAAYQAISRCEPTHFVGPINSPVNLGEKAVSKFRRLTGYKGSFFVFSKRRLRANAAAFHSMRDPEARLDFFHGFTPWILTIPERPYVAWSDCTFRDYIDTFSEREQFLPDDLDRIENTEAAWLRNAQRVLFTSDWAAHRAVSQYGLEPSQVGVVGIFGNIESPVRDEYSGGKNFVFVSTNFTAKGGNIVLSAFREVRKRHQKATLTIIGDRPVRALREPGLSCTGFLRKEVDHERQELQDILAHALAVVHPTKSDIAPLIIVEAGYVGCPVISCRRFAIPELIDHLQTGLLIEDPYHPSEVADAMCWMLSNTQEYQLMREGAWTKAHESHSRSNFEGKLLAQISGDFVWSRNSTSTARPIVRSR
jgi:glycosyltransferase involved in cell wall biosynthesis